MKLTVLASLLFTFVNASEEGEGYHCDAQELEDTCLQMVRDRMGTCGSDMYCKCTQSQALQNCYAYCPNHYDDIEEAGNEIQSYCVHVGLGYGAGAPGAPGVPMYVNPVPTYVAYPSGGMSPYYPPGTPTNYPPGVSPSWVAQPGSPQPTDGQPGQGMPPTMVPPPPLNPSGHFTGNLNGSPNPNGYPNGNGNPNSNPNGNAAYQGTWTYSTGYSNGQGSGGQGPSSSRKNAGQRTTTSILTILAIIASGILYI